MIKLRTALLIATAALCVPLLSACESDSNSEAKPTATPERDVTQESVLAGPFVKDYRAQFPKLAKGREDADIAENASDACAKVKGDDTDRADLMEDVSKDFTANGLKPNDETVMKIMELAVKDACPERAANLKAVL